MEKSIKNQHQKPNKKVSSNGNVYCLFIKRNNIGPLEIIGVATTKAKAKNMVRTIYDMYLKTIEKLEIKDPTQEPYNPENWQDHPKEKRFSFYPLNANATAYYEIIELPLNEMAVSFRAPNKETMEKYYEKKELSELKDMIVTATVNSVLLQSRAGSQQEPEDPFDIVYKDDFMSKQ